MTDCVLDTVLVVLLSLVTSPLSPVITAAHSKHTGAGVEDVKTQLSLDISARSPCPDIVPVTAVANTALAGDLSSQCSHCTAV